MCQLSELQITPKKNLPFFFHVSLTLKSVLEWAEQATALCVYEEISVFQRVMEENVFSDLE